MTNEALRAREELYQDVVAGRTPDPARVAAVARLMGVTVAAVILDVWAEARGIA